MGFEIFIGNLEKLGFYDFFLPFILFMAITYGVLSKYEPFRKDGGESTVSINGVISIVISFFIINYTPIGFYFSELFALMATVVAGILVLTIILGMFGVDVKTLFVDKGNVSKNRGLIIFAIAGIITLVIFLVSASHYLGFSLLFGGISVDQDLLFTFFVLIVMGAVVYLIVKDGNKGGE